MDLIYYYSSNHLSGNFGDLLSVYLYEKIKGKLPENYFDKNTHSPIGLKKHYFIIGSIINKANDSSVIWGSGIITKNDKINIKELENIKCVRGPYTEKILEKNFNQKLNLKLGDPGILISLYYKPKIIKKYKFGIVPHLNDLKSIKEKYSKENVKIIDLYCNNLSDIEKIIYDINSCEIILSSSLHGLITAQSYNIPCFWFKENYIPGDDIKFYDYFESVYDNKYIPKIEGKLNLGKIDTLNYIYPNLIKNRIKDLSDTCPF